MLNTPSPAQRHSSSSSTPRRKVIWATFPFNGRRGVYVAVAHADGEITVALRCDGGYRWLKALDCLTDAEARSWARWGFKHAL